MPHCLAEHGPHFHFNLRTILRVSLLAAVIVGAVADVVGFVYVNAQQSALDQRVTNVSRWVERVPPMTSAKLD